MLGTNSTKPYPHIFKRRALFKNPHVLTLPNKMGQLKESVHILASFLFQRDVPKIFGGKCWEINSDTIEFKRENTTTQNKKRKFRTTTTMTRAKAPTESPSLENTAHTQGNSNCLPFSLTLTSLFTCQVLCIPFQPN